MIDPTRHPARTGALLVTGGSALISATVWLLPASDSERGSACGVAVAMVAAAMIYRAVTRSRDDPRLLIGYPLIMFAGLAVLGHVATDVAPSYAGLFTLAFIFIGLCAPPGTTTMLLPPAVVCWLLCQGVLDHAPLPATGVRLPVVFCIWACAGGFLSQHAKNTLHTQESLRREARRDAMTGLHNRRALDDVFATARQGDIVVLLDLDRFKSINDEHGHDTGDQLIVDFARTLLRSLRGTDAAMRYGGDEFLLYMRGTRIDRIDVILERIRNSWHIASPLTTFSAGVAAVQEDGDPRAALAVADQMLYQAKHEGRDRWAQAPMIDAPRGRESDLSKQPT